MIRKRISSFKYAMDGIIHCYSQPNMIIHAVAAIVVLLTGIVVKLNAVEWAILFITITLVKAAEAVNTAIENLVDMVSPEQNEKAGLIKDISAGAVLILSMGAIGVAAVILMPKILKYFNI